MKIFDCFIYSDEEMLLDVRLNTLSNFVDKFVIVEANYKHNGDHKKQNFNIEKFKKFQNKIEYIFIDKLPKGLNVLTNNDSEDTKSSKNIRNSIILEHYQRNMISDGLTSASKDDLVLISDVDEIPILDNLNFEKNKKYPFWRLDTFLNKNKYTNVTLIDNGGWHFTQIKSSMDIFSKLNTFAHHEDFKGSGLNQEDIDKAVKEKKILYDHSADKDMQDHKWIGNKTLKNVKVDILPKYIIDNKDKFKDWIDS